MKTRARLRRDLRWPVPPADLQELDVLEILQGEDGQVLWRVDEQPAAAPQACREVLMKRRHRDVSGAEPESLLVMQTLPEVLAASASAKLPEVPEASPPAVEASSTPELPEVRDVPETQEVPQLRQVAGMPAAVLALTDMPDVPLVLQATAFLEATTALPPHDNVELMDVPAVPHVDAPEHTPPAAALPELPELAAVSALVEMPDLPPLPQAPECLDVATALQLRENLEFVDVPVLHVFQAPPEVHVLLAAHVLPEPEVQQLAELPRAVGPPRGTARPQSRELELAREWPQVVEFMEVAQASELPQFVEPHAIPEESAMDASEIPALDETHAVPLPARRPRAKAAHRPAWVMATLAAMTRSRVEPAERLALVGGGMLIGMLFMVVGGPREPATASVAATVSNAAHLTSPVPAEADAARSARVLQRMVPAGHIVPSRVPPFPITIPAETLPRSGAMRVMPSAPRKKPQAAPAVLGAIQRYAVAYNRQDARATNAVWPSADRQALVKTFSGLREQRLTLLSCTTAVDGNRATASCLGTRRYRPRVGDSATRIQRGRWRFGLQRAAGAWLIASVDAP